MDKMDFEESNGVCDWGWLECPITCGGGVQKSMISWKNDGDAECDPPKQRPCNVQPCE